MEERGRTSVGPKPDRFWDWYSRFYDSVYVLMPYRQLLWDVYQALELEPNMRVLDAGCGTGNLELFVSEKPHPPAEFHGIDFSPEMLARARHKCRNLEFATFTQHDLSKPLPYPDASFDRIVSVNVLYALEQRDETMRELLRVLKPEGRIVLTSPTPEFSIGPLLFDHVRRIRNIWGFSRKMRRVLTGSWTLVTSGLGSIVLNVAVINRRESAGHYDSLDLEGFETFLARHQQSGLADVAIGPALAQQNLFATATKMAVA
ncbi:MAG: class I SAM-dependent methyltransferase [Coriobacteriia bacterium]|jgi:ubiquinone/menaquinone biosynthesis C-methylase UbiE|nr:class I SAM-dependent methyltransferase [Coriobacteriia bacterium]